jgi:hypothetical protein
MFLVMSTVRNSTAHFSTFTAKMSVRNCSSYQAMLVLNTTDRDLYKTRLEVLFKHYPSKSFDGRSWSELSEIILVCCTINIALQDTS